MHTSSAISIDVWFIWSSLCNCWRKMHLFWSNRTTRSISIWSGFDMPKDLQSIWLLWESIFHLSALNWTLIINNSFAIFFSVLEISTHDYGPYNEHLVRKIENGSNTAYRKFSNSPSAYSINQAGKWKQF